MYKPRQKDIIWVNFTPSYGKEIRGKHPALVVSSNDYNEKTSYVIVCPITSKGNDFSGYVPLTDYKVHGRVNATQVHSFDTGRIFSAEYVDRMRSEDFLIVKQILDFALKLDF